MGVYINMEMPKNEPLLVKINPDGSVSNTVKNGYKKYEAVSVPPHGRLIDADALIANHFSDEHRIALSYADKCWMRRIINEEPTIIPAEEGE